MITQLVSGVLLASVLAFAVDGTVTDEAKGGVEGAKITLTRRDTGVARYARSAAGGKFTFDGVVAGRYLLTVEKDQFRTATREVTEAGSFDVQMQVAGVAQSVVVTADGTPEMADQLSKAFTVVTAEEIQNRNEYGLGEILKTVPGMQIRNLGGPGQLTTMRIRGLRPDAAAVLIDGLRFRDASTGQGDASSFFGNLNFIAADRVEVLRGSASSLYGTNAVGGAVNIVTQEGGGKLHGQIQGEGGMLGFWRGRATASGGLKNDRFIWTAGAMHFNLTEGIDGNDDARSTGAQLFGRYSINAKTTLSARFMGSDDFAMINISPSTTGIPAANLPDVTVLPAIPLSREGVRQLNAGLTPNYGNATYVPQRDDPDNHKAARFYSTALILRQNLTAKWSWQASYQRVHTNRVYQNGPGGYGFQPAAENYGRYAGDIDTADVRTTVLVTPWLTVSGGYEFEREGYFDRQDNNLAAARRVLVQTKIGQRSNAGYAQAQMAFFDKRLQISFSGRAQTFRLEKPEFLTTGVANNYDGLTLSAPPKALTGDVAIAYLLTKFGTKVRAHGGNAYRAAALYERFGGGFFQNSATGLVNFTPYGDPRLAPDRYNSVDYGVDQYLFGSKLRLSATQFYTRVVQVTAFDSFLPVTDPFRRTSGYVNGSGGISRGVELSGEARPVRSLTLNASYTYTNANMDRDVTIRGFYKVLVVHPHTFTLMATKQWGKKFDTTIDLFKGSSYYVGYFASTRTKAFQFPGFTKTDLVANYRLWEGERKAVRMYGKLENMFNRTFYENGNRAAGATFLMGLGYSY